MASLTNDTRRSFRHDCAPATMPTSHLPVIRQSRPDRGRLLAPAQPRSAARPYPTLPGPTAAIPCVQCILDSQEPFAQRMHSLNWGVRTKSFLGLRTRSVAKAGGAWQVGALTMSVRGPPPASDIRDLSHEPPGHARPSHRRAYSWSAAVRFGVPRRCARTKPPPREYLPYSIPTGRRADLVRACRQRKPVGISQFRRGSAPGEVFGAVHQLIRRRAPALPAIAE